MGLTVRNCGVQSATGTLRSPVVDENANGANPTHRWFDDFLDESDRGCVLIAHAIIEERLGDLIERHLLATSDGQRKLVADLRQRRGNAMGSCPACISYASKLGLISTHMAGALQQINDLRNAFAHYKQPRETRIVASHAKAIFDLLTPAQRRGESRPEHYLDRR